MFSFLYVAILMAVAYAFHAKVRPATQKIDGFLSFVTMIGFYLSFAAVGSLVPGIGAACGFYIARRGTFLWDVLLLYGIVLGVAGETALKLWRFCHTGRESAGFSMWHLSDLPVANVGLLSTYALLQRKVVAESSRPAD